MNLINGHMLMGISPGVLGSESWPDIVLKKTYELNKGFMCSLPAFIDRSVNFETIPKYNENRNLLMVCGSSTLFKVDEITKDMSREQMIKFNIERIKEASR